MNKIFSVSWAIVAAASIYSRGLGDSIQKRATYCRISSSIKTFVKRIKPHSQKMEQNVKSILDKETFIIAALDNNQKGFPKKHQRFGVCNKFVKVTASMFKKYCPIEDDTPEPTDRVKLTYIDQPIPSAYGMPKYESITTTDTRLSLICTISNVQQSRYLHDINFDGSRVTSYMSIVSICDTVINGVRRFMTGYNKSKKQYKRWKFQPIVFQSDLRDKLVKQLSDEYTFMSECSEFQYNNVKLWNSSIEEPSKLLIPPVSLRDEIRTDEFGMAVIELLV